MTHTLMLTYAFCNRPACAGCYLRIPPATHITRRSRLSRVALLGLLVARCCSGCLFVSFCEDRKSTSSRLLRPPPTSLDRPGMHPPGGVICSGPSTSSLLQLVCHRDTANAPPARCLVRAQALRRGPVVPKPAQAQRSQASHPCMCSQPRSLRQCARQLPPARLVPQLLGLEFSA